MSNIVAIVGRPNVGKSTLFNRLVGMRLSIEDSQSGVTRDRIYGKSDWCGVPFSVIDTGGYVKDSDDFFDVAIRRHVEIAIEEANAIIFLMDVTSGITSDDEIIADILRKTNKPVFTVVNKVDVPSKDYEAYDFYSMGFEKIYPISAINGHGTGELLDDLIKVLKAEPEERSTNEFPRISIVGRPNVGKSSLLNALTGEERSIVTPIAGTTRDPVFTHFNKFGFNFLLYDTAGLRKKKNIAENLEFYSYVRAIRSIEESDVCFLVIDATQGIESQDLHIFNIITENNKGVVILVNKWDLIEKNNKTTIEYEKIIKQRLAPFNDVPIIFTSALTKQRIYKALTTVMEVYENRKQRISTSKLNKLILPILKENPPPIYKGKQVKIKYITQLPTVYPSFAFFCNLPQYVKEPYKRFVENQLREFFNFKGVPIRIYFREK